jgi:tetratricopeptide (TPR) repeat protein
MTQFIKLAILSAAVFISSVSFAQTATDGLRAMENQQMTNARVIFKKLVNSAGTAENYFYLGHYYLKSGNADSALMQFSYGLTLDPKFQLNNVGLGAAKLYQNDRTSAANLFNTAITATKSKNSEVFYFIADAYLNAPQKDAVEAIKNLDVAITRNPKKVDYYLLRGDAFGEMRDGSKAVENFNQALQLEPTNARAILRKGKYYERVKNYTEASKLYQEAIDKDPNYPQAYKELGEVLYLAKKYDKAIENYEKYINMTDKSNATMLVFAQFMIRSKKFPEAITLIKEIQARDNSNPALNRGLAYAYYELQNYEMALASMDTYFATQTDKKALNLSDTVLGAKINIRGKKDTLIAAQNLAMAFRKDSTLDEDVRTFAKDIFDAKKYFYSIPLYRAIKEIKPKNQNVDYFNYGRSLYYAASLEGKKELVTIADSVFAETYAKYPTFNTALYFRGLTAFVDDKTGVKGTAIPFFEEYISKETDKVKYKTYLIRCYGSLGSYYCTVKFEKEKADKYFNEVLALDPSNAAAKTNLTDPCVKQVEAPLKPVTPAKGKPATKPVTKAKK